MTRIGRIHTDKNLRNLRNLRSDFRCDQQKAWLGILISKLMKSSPNLTEFTWSVSVPVLKSISPLRLPFRHQPKICHVIVRGRSLSVNLQVQRHFAASRLAAVDGVQNRHHL